ncbi:MAG: hypothetical protein KDG50_04325 [Chromatiales bacterium]|nr:hypothetical protein [Chromatiales bacterium]
MEAFALTSYMRSIFPSGSSLVIALTLAAVFLAAGCENRPDTEIVAERALERWQAKVAGEFEKVWDFQSPAYRASHNKTTFIAAAAPGPAVSWDGAEILSVSPIEGEPDLMNVLLGVSYTAKVPGVKPIPSHRQIAERWSRIDGDWWYQGLRE